MATVTKNFKIKHGLVVEGTTGTINNFDILTKSTDDQQYIVDLVGGDAASNAVRRSPSGSKGHVAVIGFSSVGFSASASGAGASETISPPNALATSAMR